ncbi:MAG: hypothetical protein ACI89L_002555 [Phycisphaerales bacterium]|jgi:hypothetical protein
MAHTKQISRLGRFTTLSAVAAVMAAAGCALAQPADGQKVEDGVSLTIYSSAQPGAISPDMYRPVPGQNIGYYRGNQIPGYAVIKQVRTIDLAQGRGEARFDDVAAYIDPTTVQFVSLTDPGGTRVLEQDFRFDLVDPSKLLRKRLGEKITLNGQSVKLLGLQSGGMVVQDDEGSIFYHQGMQGVKFDASIADDMVIKPTLSWDLVAAQGGEHQTRVSYQAAGITWWADYNLVFTPGEDANHGTLDVGSWVSILNQSGATFDDAQLKLIAGDVNRAPQSGRNEYQARGMVGDRAVGAMAAPGFAEKSFFEYHLYTLGRPTTIVDASTKQVELFETARGVPADKVMVFDGLGGQWNYWGFGRHTNRSLGQGIEPKVEVYLRFDNSEDDGLGVPLPAGRIRVSQMDTADGSLEFIGEDVIDHTPREEEILIKLGNAFDIVGERTQTDFQSGNYWMSETIEIKLRNRKKDDSVDVLVQERLFRWNEWDVTQTTDGFTKADARTIRWNVTLAPDEEKIITFTVRYNWE